MKQPLGITFESRPGVDSLGVYASDTGVEAFETSEPYLLSDGKSLVSPLSVFDAGGPVYTDSMGNARQALAVSGLVPRILWDQNTPWDENTEWS